MAKLKVNGWTDIQLELQQAGEQHVELVEVTPDGGHRVLLRIGTDGIVLSQGLTDANAAYLPKNDKGQILCR